MTLGADFKNKRYSFFELDAGIGGDSGNLWLFGGTGNFERIGDVSKGLPRKRICVPEQMDSTLLFLVSPSSECVTGTCIKIDDGQTAR